MGPIYDIYVAPKHKLEMSIAFRPTAVEQHAFEMPLVMTGTGAIGEHRRAVTAAGTQPKVVISPGITMDFGTQVVRSTQQKRISTALEAKLRTNLDTEVPFEFAAPSTDTQENGKGVFVVHPSSGVILPGQEVVLSVEFVPREIKLYEVRGASTSTHPASIILVLPPPPDAADFDRPKSLFSSTESTI